MRKEKMCTGEEEKRRRGEEARCGGVALTAVFRKSIGMKSGEERESAEKEGKHK